MPFIPKVVNLCRNLFWKRRIEADLAEELRGYVEELTERKIQAGAEPIEARRLALIEIGGAEPLKERLRDARMGASIISAVENIWRDLCYAARCLIHAPHFSIPAIVSLALGIAIASCTFSIVNAYLFRPAPVRNGDKLLVLAAQRPTSKTLRYYSYPNYRDVLEHNDVFGDLVAYTIIDSRLSSDEVSLRATGQAVSGNYFDAFGIEPALGRVLTLEDDSGRGAPGLVIGHDLWTNYFASDPSVVGRAIRLNGSPFTIVGVAPKQFRGTDSLVGADLWITITKAAEAGIHSTTDRAGWRFRVLGFLKPGITVGQAQMRIDAITAGLRDQYPVENRDLKSVIVPERETRPIIDAAKMVPPIAALLLGAVALGLTIDGASVTSLLLARSFSRQREVSLRLALGASRGRLFGQLLVESLLLSFVSGGLGLLATNWLMTTVSEANLPISLLIDVRPDTAVTLFTVLVAMLTGIAVGTLPALTAVRSDIRTGLAGGAHVTVEGKPARLRGQVVASQFSVLTLLLVVMGLFIGSVRNASRIDPGFETKNRLLMTLSPSEFAYDETPGRQLVEEFLSRVRTLPGVESAAAVYEPPLSYGSSSLLLAPADGLTGGVSDRIPYTVVTPGYFETIRTPILQGRSFNDRDRMCALPVAVINDTLAKHFWPGENVLGKRLLVRRDTGRGSLVEVIGVAKTGKYSSLREEARDFAWFPYAQFYSSSMTVVAYSDGDLKPILGAALRALKELDSAVSLSGITNYDQLVQTRTVGSLEVAATLIGVIGLLGFIRAALGMYGLLSFFAKLQTREIGIRMAFGATTSTIMRLVIARGFKLAIRGIAGGFVFAIIATRLLQSFLIGTDSIDLVTWLGVPLLLATVTFIAGYLPIRRVLAGNPMNALHHE